MAKLWLTGIEGMCSQRAKWLGRSQKWTISLAMKVMLDKMIRKAASPKGLGG
jgi:hypothetical protein